jgi:glutamate synthase domain-containing protein 1
MNDRWSWSKEISGCGLAGLISRRGHKIPGEVPIQAIANLHDRGNGLGGGFAGYGIYPNYADYYAIHTMYYNDAAHNATEEYLRGLFYVVQAEIIPTAPGELSGEAPNLWRYFAAPKSLRADKGETEADAVMNAVMWVNQNIDGAYIFSSGKNMGAFKAVGFAEDVGRFFRLQEYEGYIWTAHGRFPTNTQAWWGGAHPFCLLDYSVVHNGEISSYGINRRYLEGFGYKCTLQTDTEVMVYLLDLLIRRHGLSIEMACTVLAPPFWKTIDRPDQDPEVARLYEALRITYGPAVVNGPFAILFAHSRGLVGFNDRIKLRPMVAAEKDDMLYIASEEAAIHVMCETPDRIWTPQAGHPVIGTLDDSVTN